MTATQCKTEGRAEVVTASPELERLRARIALMPIEYRRELEPMADEAIEEAVFRGRVLSIAREGLERYKLDLAMARFDLEATRREREALKARVESFGL